MGDDDCYATPHSSSEAPKLHRPLSVPPRLQYPHVSLCSNDDHLERAQARAARAAAIRRHPAAHPPPPSHEPQDLFDKDQIMDLYRNCIKLATENKINKKNMWELHLIDHLSEIIRAESEEHNQTNFQKASCTLEAGVKIYSLRVDSVHAEAYMVLGVINWAGRGDDEESVTKVDHNKNERKGGVTKEELDMKLSPLATLESSLEVLNSKKFDVAFMVDPLYHQMSGQFDEGGAKGLLLSNLGVYAGCHVIFDSFEVPEKSMAYKTHNDESEVVDLSFLKETIGQMLTHMPRKIDISPTLSYIVRQFNENIRRPEFFSPSEETVLQDGIVNSHTDFDGNANDHSSVIGQTDQDVTMNKEDDDDYTVKGSDIDEDLGKLAGLLSLGLGFNSKSNAWAGPDHWKYRKNKGLDKNPVPVTRPEIVTKNRKKGLPDICFTQSLDKKTEGVFSPPKNPRSLLLPVNRVLCNTSLPDDCHYKPESLVRLFVLPNCMIFGKKGRRSLDEWRQQNFTSHTLPSRDTDQMTKNSLNDGHGFSDVDDHRSPFHQPGQVNKDDIQYDKVSKQVNVHALKEMLWNDIQDSIHMPEMGCEARVSFKQVLHRHFSNDRRETSARDISPHLFFICLLHLANEHALIINDCLTLNELDIHVPSSALV